MLQIGTDVLFRLPSRKTDCDKIVHSQRHEPLVAAGTEQAQTLLLLRNAARNRAGLGTPMPRPIMATEAFGVRRNATTLSQIAVSLCNNSLARRPSCRVTHSPPAAD